MVTFEVFHLTAWEIERSPLLVENPVTEMEIYVDKLSVYADISHCLLRTGGITRDVLTAKHSTQALLVNV